MWRFCDSKICAWNIEWSKRNKVKYNWKVDWIQIPFGLKCQIQEFILYPISRKGTLMLFEQQSDIVKLTPLEYSYRSCMEY